MDTLHVSRFHARYRLPADEPDAAPRLARVLSAVLEEGVEHALARSGVPTHEEICIRAVHAPVRLRYASADPALIGTWSVGLADAIQRSISDGGPDIVRYRTRNHAFVDLLEGVAGSDFRRAWAWRTLGLWTLPDPPSASDSVREAVRALVAHPEAVVAALAGAARAGALPRLAGAIPLSGWLELARAALGASPLSPAGADRLVRQAALRLGGPGRRKQGQKLGLEREPERGDGDGGPRRVVAPVGTHAPRDDLRTEDAAEASAGLLAPRVARLSEIARALSMMPFAQPGLAWILSVLAVLEADPSALHGDGPWASTLVERVLREAWGAEEGRAAAGPDDPPEARTVQGLPAAPSTPDPERDGAPGPRAPAAPGHATEEALDASDGAGETGDASSAEPPLAEITATTEWGGLLFLLHVVDELGLPAEILAADVFHARPLAWVLHGVAGCLLHLDAGDPAAAAFAGGVPGRRPPWDGDDPASQAEEGALERLSQRVAARVHERLTGEPAPAPRAAAATVRACARRRAELRCETGWFDVLLRLDEVVVETRRAGLDLDPGWIPWLGVVVRFVYV